MSELLEVMASIKQHEWIFRTEYSVKNPGECDVQTLKHFYELKIHKHSTAHFCKNTYIKYSLNTLEWLPVGSSVWEEEAREI